MSDKSTVKNENSKIGNLYSILRAFIAFLIAAILSIPITALICYSLSDPISYIETAGVIALYISLAVSGFLCAKSSGDGIRTTLFYAVIMLIILMLAGLIPTGTVSDNLMLTIIKYAIVPAAVLIGGSFGAKKKKRKASSHKNAHRKKKKH